LTALGAHAASFAAARRCLLYLLIVILGPLAQNCMIIVIDVVVISFSVSILLAG